MRHWNSPKLNPLTNKNNEKSENKTWANSFLIQYALYNKHICFRLQLTLILVVAFVFFKGSIFCCIQPFLLKSDGNGRYMYRYPIWLARAFVQCNAWTKERRSANCIGARPIVRLSGHSCDPIALSHSTRFHCTSVAYQRKIYSKIHCIYIAERRFESCEFCMSTFSFANTLWTVYDPYLIFSVARIFCSPARASIVKGTEDAFKFNF